MFRKSLKRAIKFFNPVHVFKQCTVIFLFPLRAGCDLFFGGFFAEISVVIKMQIQVRKSRNKHFHQLTTHNHSLQSLLLTKDAICNF